MIQENFSKYLNKYFFLFLSFIFFLFPLFLGKMKVAFAQHSGLCCGCHSRYDVLTGVCKYFDLCGEFCTGGGTVPSYCYGAPPPPVDKDCALGPMVRFVYFNNLNNVSWPPFDINSSTSWVEDSLTNKCTVTPPYSTMVLSGIKTRTIVYRRGAGGIWDYIEPIYRPSTPSCSNHLEWSKGNTIYPGESLVGTYVHKKKDSNATWIHSATTVMIPKGSNYRLFGIRIKDVVQGTSRPVRGKRYVWEGRVYVTDDEGCTDETCGYNYNDGLGFYPGKPSQDMYARMAGIKCGERDCSKLRINKSPNRAAWAVGSYYRNKDHCSGRRAYYGCPQGYTPAPATYNIQKNCYLGDCNAGNITEDGFCPENAEEKSFMNTPRYNVFTCKKVENDVLFASDWKPERGDEPIYLNRGDWLGSPQKLELWQTFTFTVDKDGYYYFVRCHESECEATMTINGGGFSNVDGWRNQYYRKGTEYTANFKCTRGKCFYGLPLAPKSILEDSIYSKLLTAVLVDRIIPPPTCTINISSISYALNGQIIYPFSVTMNIADNGNTILSKTIDATATPTSNVQLTLKSTVSGSNYLTKIYEVRVFNSGSNSVNGTITASGSVVSDAGSGTCSNSISFSIYPAFSWFQTQGGDVHEEGIIQSRIPYSDPIKYFSLNLNSYPGLISFRDSYNFGQGGVSSKGWLAKSSFFPNYDYSYFYQKLGSPTEDNFSCDPSCPTPSSGETKIYYSRDDVTISGNDWNLPSNAKMVVLINGDLNISLNQGKRIIVPVGSFLAFIVKGDIKISGNVGDKLSSTTPHLQGVYIADGIIDTYQPNPTGEGSGFRLVGAGLFYAKGGFRLERDVKNDCGASICNATTPSEFFIFRPDLVINSPREIWTSEMTWTEVAP